MGDQQEWNSSEHLHSMSFERKPVLEDISIVIPTLGRPVLERCLYWILRGSAWPGCLIVVEQGSSKCVEKWIKHIEGIGIRVKHILSNQRGRSAGLNRGLEQTDTRYVAITDDDCFVGEEWLGKMADKLRMRSDTVVTGRVEAAGEDMIVLVSSSTPSIQSSPRIKFDSMSGGNMGTSLTVFRKVGLFDEDPVMATAEDAEWSYRALRKGIPLIYEPDIMVRHLGWRDVGKRVEQYRHYALSHGGFYGKYLRRGDLFIFIRAVSHFMRALRRWIRGKLTGNTEYVLLARAYCQNLLPGILAGMRSKMRWGELK